VYKASNTTVCNLFYGYSVEEIMRVCVVSRATATHFKRGSRSPSPQAQRLWWLHLHGRILGPEWRRFRVCKNALVDEAGNEYLEDEIASIPLLHQQIANLKAHIDKIRYAEAVGELGFFDLTNSLRKVVQECNGLLTEVEKVPRRRTRKSESDERLASNEQLRQSG
jgi:transcriptional regulator with XRE-family HTH domain